MLNESFPASRDHQGVHTKSHGCAHWRAVTDEVDWRRINQEAVAYTGERFDENGTLLSSVNFGPAEARIDELETALRVARNEIDQMELASIEVRNPGIDMYDVRRLRILMGASRRLAVIDKVLEGL